MRSAWRCWRRLLRVPGLLRVPWKPRRSNQSIPKEINPEYSLEGLMLKLKLQFFGHLMWRVDSFEKTLMLGKIEGRRRIGQQRMRWLDSITDLMDMSWENSRRWWRQGRLACCSPWSYKKSYILRDWPTTNNSFINVVNYIGWCFNKCTEVWFTYLKIINFKCIAWWVLGNIHCCATTVTNYCPKCFLLPVAVHWSSYSRI